MRKWFRITKKFSIGFRYDNFLEDIANFILIPTIVVEKWGVFNANWVIAFEWLVFQIRFHFSEET